MKTGGQILVDCLEAQGANHAFCVPGESYLAVLDAFHDARIELTVCRQEGGAAMMAEAHGKLTGQPGLCFVTRGPGATNAAAGLHIAMQDSTPMILFIGQVGRDMIEREAFQEIDYRQFFGSVVKWVAQIDDVDRIPEFVARAYATAMQGRPGPVVLALPEDMLRDMSAAQPAAAVTIAEPYPAPDAMVTAEKLLANAKRPFIIAGGSRWDEEAVSALQTFAEKQNIPVGVSFRRQMLFDHTHPNYAGDVGLGINPALAAQIREADVLLLIGGRFGENPSQSYSLMNIPTPDQRLVHVHPGADELGRVYAPTVALHATPGAFLQVANASWKQAERQGAAEQVKAARAAFDGWTDEVTTRGDLQMGAIMTWLNAHLPDDAIMTNGAGNYASWLHRYYRFRAFGTQLAPTSGSMGYGVPAAVGAKRVAPEKTVVCFAGDGCFMMHGQEFAAAVQYGAPIIILLIDNSMYGTIRMHQEKTYPGRISATELRNPDFAAFAKAYGGHGETVTRTEDFAPAFQRAEASGLPAILHLKLDPEVITPTATLSQLRAAAAK